MNECILADDDLCDLGFDVGKLRLILFNVIFDCHILLHDVDAWRLCRFVSESFCNKLAIFCVYSVFCHKKSARRALDVSNLWAYLSLSDFMAASHFFAVSSVSGFPVSYEQVSTRDSPCEGMSVCSIFIE